MHRPTAVVVLASLLALAVPAHAHEGNKDFESLVRGVSPVIEGVRVQILNGDDRLEVRNKTGKTLIIEGYEGEPYARLLPDGRVQVNERSSATYLNEERFGGADVPETADAKAAPRWRAVDRVGAFDFHDHRIHWMAKGDPPIVRDKGKRTRVFAWKVPVRVDGRPAAIGGELFWRGRDAGGAPSGLIGGSLAALAAAAALVLRTRKRRRSDPRDEAEAW